MASGDAHSFCPNGNTIYKRCDAFLRLLHSSEKVKHGNQRSCICDELLIFHLLASNYYLFLYLLAENKKGSFLPRKGDFFTMGSISEDIFTEQCDSMCDLVGLRDAHFPRGLDWCARVGSSNDSDNFQSAHNSDPYRSG